MQNAVDTALALSETAWIEIRREKLLGNLSALKNFQGHCPHLLAVVKANAYGHGIEECARILSGQADFLGISSLREAEILRHQGYGASIFLFGRFSGRDLLRAMECRATLSVSSLDEAEDISEAAGIFCASAKIHVKIDTGMGRMGIPLREAESVVARIRALPYLDLEGIYSHLPAAEKDDGFTETQMHNFCALVRRLETMGICFKYRHLSNSSGIMKTGDPLLNLIRPGLSLYGIYPDPKLPEHLRVEPILALRSKIIFVKKLEAGETSGYGRDFVADKTAYLGILPLGYSHGYPFAASNRAFFLHRGRRFQIAGRVSMDYIAVHFGSQPPAVGDVVTLLGEDHGGQITAEEIASWAGTIPYEIVTQLSPYLPRYIV